jgi:hypothetical protein
MKKLTALLLSIVTLVLLPAQALAATLSLSPASGTFNKGCTVTLNILLDTQGAATDGVDAILLYDTTRFSATKITNGTIYSEYPGNIIEAQAGRVIVSGSASAASPFSGSGVLAKVDFSVLPQAPVGAAQIKFDFDGADRTKTTDSNVAERNNVTDVLSAVVDGSYAIGSGTGCVVGQGSTGAVASGSAEVAVPVKTLPVAADMNTTLIVTAAGLMLTVLGILGLAFL